MDKEQELSNNADEKITFKEEGNMSSGICKEEGCESKPLKAGLCYKHFIAAHGREKLPESMQKHSTVNKVCPDCKKEFDAKSNLAMRCNVCAKEHKRKIDREKKKEKKTLNKKIIVNVNSTSPGISKESICTSIQKSGKTPLQGISPASHSITVDFSDYPELLDFLRATAKESFRSPEMLITYFVSIAKSNTSAPGPSVEVHP